MKRVLILYKFLPQYRLEFFEQLKIALNKEGVELELIYGKLKNTDSLKKDEVEISWARFVPNKVIRLGKTELVWQPCLRYMKGIDLVIVEQANKLVINYLLMLIRYFSGFKFANWGHGRNMQDDPNSTRNKFKYGYIKLCDWWFAYTQGVRDFLISQGYPENKITVVQNAIETVNLRKYYSEIPEAELIQLRSELGIEGSKVGIYCGGMYKEKRLDFMLDICYRVKEQVPDFHMIFIGSGVDSYKAEEAAAENKWIHYVGPKFGQERVKYFRLASIQLMPGLVGLGILDSFALETPIFTTEYPHHSPEIEYLHNNVNGVMTRDDLEEYSQTIIDVMKSGKYLELIEGCRKSSEIYTVENMVENFKNGILTCLNS
jgi:glycosyltransferase involved in cell wall biosynthesis